jgi:nicotinamidase-related amidase
MNRQALIVIDYTVDFVADEGRLTCGAAGQAIEGKITELTRSFAEANRPVVFAVDVHDEGDVFHPETKLFPPHNVRGTSGRDLYGQLGAFYRDWTDQGLTYPVKWMDKTRYSAFAGTDLEMYLRARNIDQVHLVGVCTDICVLHTAVDAYNKGFQIVIHRDAVASFNPSGHAWALEHFAGSLGAEIR